MICYPMYEGEIMKERIRDLRKSLKLSQDNFGKKIGISGAAISKIESGVNFPSEATVKLICSTYKVNYLWLTEGRGEMMLDLSLEHLVDKYMAGESPLAVSIMKAFVRLPDEEWTKFRDMIDRIKKEGL